LYFKEIVILGVIQLHSDCFSIFKCNYNLFVRGFTFSIIDREKVEATVQQSYVDNKCEKFKYNMLYLMKKMGIFSFLTLIALLGTKRKDVILNLKDSHHVKWLKFIWLSHLSKCSGGYFSPGPGAHGTCQ